MNIRDQIRAYFSTLAEPKRKDMLELHRRIRALRPGCRLWFLDGRDAKGKVVSNPNVGYGHQSIAYADGTSRDSYQVGISANSTGISVYILGLTDKTHLARTYGKALGKATVTGYCIKFRALKDVDLEVLEAAIGFGLDR